LESGFTERGGRGHPSQTAARYDAMRHSGYWQAGTLAAAVAIVPKPDGQPEAYAIEQNVSQHLCDLGHWG
jgi:aerobic-type carbon monoxide dehydrogenase small subunit (CoxS/CutS family)